MANRNPPPIKDTLLDEQGVLTFSWTLFFNQVYQGDTGTSFTPDFESLTSTGTPTLSGRYYRLSQYLIAFRVTIIPDTDTSAVSGTTYIQNLPFVISADAPCFAVLPPTSASGACVSSTNRIYVPAWTSVTVPITITGLVEAR